jgi:cell wall-associated NlpC family hydrolase
VYYIYRELGMAIPRSAAEQHQRAMPVERDELLPGDLVFFKINRRRISHVGIYVGENRFVHSPQTGKHVELRNLDDIYFARRFVGAGRLQ